MAMAAHRETQATEAFIFRGTEEERQAAIAKFIRQYRRADAAERTALRDQQSRFIKLREAKLNWGWSAGILALACAAALIWRLGLRLDIF